MARGGPRQGAGRKHGAGNKRTTEMKAEAAKVIETISAAIPNAFDGDAHAFMVSLYKNPSIPFDMRLDAAKSAAPYEKPRLSAVDMSATVKRSIEDFTYEELAIIAAGGEGGGVIEDEGDRDGACQPH